MGTCDAMLNEHIQGGTSFSHLHFNHRACIKCLEQMVRKILPP